MTSNDGYRRDSWNEYLQSNIFIKTLFITIVNGEMMPYNNLREMSYLVEMLVLILEENLKWREPVASWKVLTVAGTSLRI